MDALPAESLPVGHEGGFLEAYGWRMLSSLRKVARIVDVYSRKLNTEIRITTPQMVFLHVLSQEGAMTLTSLAGKVNLSVSTINGIADRLEVKGLITRTRSESDRRKVFVEVTETGRELAESAFSLHRKFFSSLATLPELEQAAIALSLERLAELMEGGSSESEQKQIT